MIDAPSFLPRAVRYGLLPVVVAGALLVLVTACDTLQASDESLDDAALEEDEVSLATLIADTATSLNPTDEQADAIGAVAGRFEGQPPEPGLLWEAAAELHATLTTTQIDSLEDRLRSTAERIAERRSERGGFGGGPGMHNGPPQGGPGGMGPGGGGPGGMGPGGGDAEPLNLTDEQRDELRALRQTSADALAATVAAFVDGSLSEDEVMAAYQTLLADREAAFREILTDEQEAIVDERRAEREARRDEMTAARNAALDLADEQAAAFTALHLLEPRRALIASFDTWLNARDAILSYTQTDITIVHASLRAEQMRQRRGNRGPGGRFGGGPGNGAGGPGGFGGGPGGGW